ncbi:hypothetical protein HDU67_002757 [Dinochytrium kinnereticum]|nr:hypothetical protein HDU67_002757 [Dinochytrium kinnereticum]
MDQYLSPPAPPPQAVRAGDASSPTASQEDVISLAARTLNPDHLRNASNEELLRIMQSLKKSSDLNQQSGSQEMPMKGAAAQMGDEDANGMAAAPAAESDSMSGVHSYSPNRTDMRRQSVSLPLYSEKPSSGQMYSIDRRGSLGSLPRMLGVTDRDDVQSSRSSYQQIPPSDADGSKDEGEAPLRIPLARSSSPQPAPSQQPGPSPDQRLRLEVETTLHKTLELEYMLTMKEFKSYETQAATAEIELNRATVAYKETEAILRERRRELDSAIQEQSEVQSIMRYLSTRLEGLTSRIRDGSNRLASLRGGKSPTSAPASSVPSSLISSRRHSSPGLLTLNSQMMDEWGRPDSRVEMMMRKADEERLTKADSEVATLSGTSGSNQKRARTTSPADGEADLSLPLAERRGSLSVITSMIPYGHGPSSALSNAEAPSLNSLSATDTDSHSHAHAHGQHHHHHSHGGASAQVACVAYQKIQCPLSTKDCPSLHACIRCNGAHPVIMCKKDRNVCVKWNMEDCASACHREHRCLRCASKEHTLRVCPIRPLGGAEFCFAWNSAGTCRIMDCRRLHECIRCGTSHPSIICPENLDNYLIEYIKRRRGEGVSEDELQRLEAQINISLPQNGPSVLPPGASMSISLAGLAPSNNNIPHHNNPNSYSPQGGMGITQTHPMHMAAVAAASASLRQPIPQQQQQQQQQMMGSNQYMMQQQYGGSHAASPHMVSSKMLMSALDVERSSKRLRGDNNNVNADIHGFPPPPPPPPSSGYSRMVGVGGVSGNPMMMNGNAMMAYQQQQYGFGGLVGGGGPGTGAGSYLTEMDRKSICRDYNNFKCDVEDSLCRFRHVCLRCGGADHREKNCGLFEASY